MSLLVTPATSFLVGTNPDPSKGTPSTSREPIADDWESTLPELVADLPSLDMVRERLDAYLVESIAPELNE